MKILVDKEDEYLLDKFEWRISTAGYPVTGGMNISLHKMVLGFPNCIIDHINNNKLDCRKINLRNVNQSENSRNTFSRKGTSKYKGVFWAKHINKWIANIKHNYRNHYLGSFTNEEDAAKAYDKAARLFHGEFGRFNFPLENERPALKDII
jgi:hypothetical protein